MVCSERYKTHWNRERKLTMASSLDKSRDYRAPGGKGAGLSIAPTPLLEESKRYYAAATEAGDRAVIANLPTLQHPAIDIAQLHTQVSLKAAPKPSDWSNSPDPSSPYFLMLNGLSIDEQPTWLLPVIQVPRGTLAPGARVSGAEGYASLIRNLIKNSGIYALASLASPLISLVLAPFLTRYLASADYGALAILNTVIALVAGITQLGLNFAFFRAYNYDYESQRDRLGVLSTVVMMLLLISIPTAGIAIMASPWLAALLLGNASLSDPVRVAAVVVLLQNLTVPGFAWLRAENRAMLFSLLSITNLLVGLGANIILVGVLHMGIVGSLIASGGGYAVVVIATLPVILRRAGMKLRFDIAWGLLIFGLPHTSNLVSGWVLQLSDRYLLGHLASLSQAASYTVAYSLGGVLTSVIIMPFSLAWWAMMYIVAKREDAPRLFRLVFRWFSAILLFATFGFSLFSISLLNLFFPSAYHSAAPIIPIIAASSMFNGIYVIVSVGISIQRKTWLAAVLTTSSALLNVTLNLVLIPHYGASGAAVSTLIAYMVFALMAYVVNQRIYPIPFEIGLFGIALLLGVALYIGSNFLAQTQQIYLAWSIHIGTLILYGGCLLLLAKLPGREFNTLYK